MGNKEDTGHGLPVFESLDSLGSANYALPEISEGMERRYTHHSPNVVNKVLTFVTEFNNSLRKSSF